MTLFKRNIYGVCGRLCFQVYPKSTLYLHYVFACLLQNIKFWDFIYSYLYKLIIVDSTPTFSSSGVPFLFVCLCLCLSLSLSSHLKSVYRCQALVLDAEGNMALCPRGPQSGHGITCINRKIIIQQDEC